MKNIFIILLLFIGFAASAQTTTKQGVVTASTVFNYGGLTDTIKKSTAFDYYVVNVAPFAKQIKFRVNTTRTSGTYTKARFVLQKSMNNTTWENVDSVSIASATASNTGILALKTDIYAPMFRIKAYAYDSTQVVRYKYNILIDVNNK